MRKKKFLNLTFALALVAGLFAGSLGSVAALSPVYGPEIAGNPTIYFPFVYNGTMLNGMGPFDGSVTIQNQEVFPITVDVMDASGSSLKSGVLYNPRASKTWSASQLGIADGGGGVMATAHWTSSAVSTMLNLNMCDSQVLQFTRGNESGGTDSQSNPFPRADKVTVGNFSDAGTYTKTTDYLVHSDGTIAVDWSPKGNEPAAGTTYDVTVYYCGSPSIAGVEKHVAPVQNSSAVKTSSDQTTVDGYTALGNCDLAVAADELVDGCNLGQGISLPELDLQNQSRWILPIVQTNSGWDSIIHITNVSGSDGVGVSALYYASGGQGVAGPSEQLLSTTLDSGETVSFDLKNDGNFPDGNVGSVWVDADAGVVASVDRVKAATDMALTNVAQPRNDNALNYFKIFGQNPTVKYAPLVFKDYNNWNTGINIANLSSNSNHVTVTFYNYLDNSMSSDTVDIPPRAMEYVYMPGSGNDIGLGPGGISSAVISGSDPIAVAVDEVKYTGGQGMGHGMSYPAQYGAFAGFAYDTGQFPFLTDLFKNITGFGGGRVLYNWQLNLPLLQKGSNTTGLGDYSGINLFNADPSQGLTAWVQFEDTAGVPVAPTTGSNEREIPIQLSMGPLSSHTIYTANYSELPDGFVGSAVVGVVYSSLDDAEAKIATGPLVGVSNNVNYDVSGDGSSVFNMNPGFHWLPGQQGQQVLPPGCYYPGFSFQVGGALDCTIP